MEVGSNRCHRIARAVKTANVQALILDLYFAFVFRDLIEETLGRKLKLEALTNWKTIFNTIKRDRQNPKYNFN